MNKNLKSDIEDKKLTDEERISLCLLYCYENAKPDGDISALAFDAWCSGRFKESNVG